MSGGDARDERDETPHEAQRLSARRLLLIVFVFLVLAVYSIWNSDRFQTLMLGLSEQRLSELLKRPVSFTRVQFKIFPPSLTLANVRIENDPRIPGEPLLSASELTIGGGVSVSGSELRLGRVRAVEPKVSLVQFDDGTWNLPPGLTGPAEKQGLAVRVGELVIQRGLFELEGRQMGMDGRLEDFALELKSLRRGRYAGTLASRRAELKLPNAEPLLFGLDLAFRLDPERGASIDKLRAVGEFGDLRASGGVERPGENSTILLLLAGEVHISEVERIFRAKLGFAGDASIRAEVRIPPAGGFRIAGKLSAPKVDAKGFLFEDLEATVSARPEALVAEISQARYAGGLASGPVSHREPRRGSAREADDARPRCAQPLARALLRRHRPAGHRALGRRGAFDRPALGGRRARARRRRRDPRDQAGPRVLDRPRPVRNTDRGRRHAEHRGRADRLRRNDVSFPGVLSRADRRPSDRPVDAGLRLSAPLPRSRRGRPPVSELHGGERRPAGASRARRKRRGRMGTSRSPGAIRK